MQEPPVIIIGGGIAGLVAAIDVASARQPVVLLEMAATPGGKMRQVQAGGTYFDAGPTVMTMASVFEEIFANAGENLHDHITLTKADVLARHAWSRDERLDLFADKQQSAQAIGEFAGPSAARAYLAFCDESARIFRTLEQPYMRAAMPGLLQLMRRVGPAGLLDLARTQPFTSLWSALGRQFKDARLQQLFGRYATYCGSSPFAAPATLMLIAHVEQAGVWLIDGGMFKLAEALAGLARRRGVDVRYGARVAKIHTKAGRADAVTLSNGEVLQASAIILNADSGALALGMFGQEVRTAAATVPQGARTLSAMTFSFVAKTSDFPLSFHNVFFSRDYPAEFNAIFKHGRIPAEPTVYVCAQDRNRQGTLPEGLRDERLFCLVNAPPNGDQHTYSTSEIDECRTHMMQLLARCGLQVEPSSPVSVSTPTDFNRLFPASGGALYGRASHGWMASFSRMGSASRIPGLYLAGGSVHPGAGVPMAALSGRLAASQLMADRALTQRLRHVAMSGGMLTR